MRPTNGARKVATWIAGVIGAILVTNIATYIATHDSRVEAAVVEQRMVNEHDETLKKLVPKVDNDAMAIAVQQRDLALEAQDHERIWRAIEQQKMTVQSDHEMLQLYLQSRMKAGEIPR